MTRRQFITLLGGAAAWPLAARAQQRATPTIGFLNATSLKIYEPRVNAFRQGLSETGYVEGRNVAIQYRWAEGHYDQLRALAADLVRRQVDVIVATGSSAAALAAKAATTTIPIVFTTGSDPVQLGLVSSLSRPGGNVTGATVLAAELGPKRLEVLHELVPAATNIALLVNPTNPTTETYISGAQMAARAFGIQLHILHASTEADFDTVLATLVPMRADGLVITADQFLFSRSEQLAALALRYAVPTISGTPEFAAAGGLMSYAGSATDEHRTAGVYTGRILKGEKPADLPVQQSTKVELIINLKTAKALGITLPVTLRALATEVIE